MNKRQKKKHSLLFLGKRIFVSKKHEKALLKADRTEDRDDRREALTLLYKARYGGKNE